MAILQLYLPSREGAAKALDVAQKRPKGKGPKPSDPVAQAQAALTDVDKAEVALNTAVAAGYDVLAQYPAMHSVGVNLILYKKD